MKLMLVMAGGGVGAGARYLLSTGLHRVAPGSLEGLPVGTLTVNVLGCLFIGVASAYFLARPNVGSEEYRLMLMVGLLGGFTTFSAFGKETFDLINNRQWVWAATYVLLSNAAGLFAVWLGYRLTERLNDN